MGKAAGAIVNEWSFTPVSRVCLHKTDRNKLNVYLTLWVKICAVDKSHLLH
jgi:hypothetical protein